jgi:hypothetical protein
MRFLLLTLLTLPFCFAKSPIEFGKTYVMVEANGKSDKNLGANIVKVFTVDKDGNSRVVFSKDFMGYPDWMHGKFKMEDGISVFYAEPQGSQNQTVYKTLGDMYINRREHKSMAQELLRYDSENLGIKYYKPTGKDYYQSETLKHPGMNEFFKTEIYEIDPAKIEEIKEKMYSQIKCKFSGKVKPYEKSNKVVKGTIKCPFGFLTVVCNAKYKEDAVKCLYDNVFMGVADPSKEQKADILKRAEEL